MYHVYRASFPWMTSNPSVDLPEMILKFCEIRRRSPMSTSFRKEIRILSNWLPSRPTVIVEVILDSKISSSPTGSHCIVATQELQLLNRSCVVVIRQPLPFLGGTWSWTMVLKKTWNALKLVGEVSRIARWMLLRSLVQRSQWCVYARME